MLAALPPMLLLPDRTPLTAMLPLTWTAEPWAKAKAVKISVLSTTAPTTASTKRFFIFMPPQCVRFNLVFTFSFCSEALDPAERISYCLPCAPPFSEKPSSCGRAVDGQASRTPPPQPSMLQLAVTLIVPDETTACQAAGVGAGGSPLPSADRAEGRGERRCCRGGTGAL